MKKLFVLSVLILASVTARAQQEEPGRSGQYHQTTTRIDYVSDNLTVYTTSTDEYTGGAHGMSSVHYVNVDAKTGNHITLRDLYPTRESRNALAEAIRAQILKDNGVRSWAALQQKTCYLDAEEVKPTENFRLGEGTITFTYNPYDIACYAQGATSVTIPRN